MMLPYSRYTNIRIWQSRQRLRNVCVYLRNETPCTERRQSNTYISAGVSVCATLFFFHFFFLLFNVGKNVYVRSPFHQNKCSITSHQARCLWYLPSWIESRVLVLNAIHSFALFNASKATQPTSYLIPCWLCIAKPKYTKEREEKFYMHIIVYIPTLCKEKPVHRHIWLNNLFVHSLFFCSLFLFVCVW